MKKVGTVYTKGTEEVNLLPGRFTFRPVVLGAKEQINAKKITLGRFHTLSSND